MQEKISRYDINRRVKMILSRHAVDLSHLHYSSAGRTVYIYGTLLKDPEGDFEISEIRTIISELNTIPEIQGLDFDISNWTLSYEPGAMVITSKK